MMGRPITTGKCRGICVHCHQPRKRQGQGLCAACHGDPVLRQWYHVNPLRKGLATAPSGYRVPVPTDVPAGTTREEEHARVNARLRVYEERAARGEQLFHKDDAERDLC